MSVFSRLLGGRKQAPGVGSDLGLQGYPWDSAISSDTSVLDAHLLHQTAIEHQAMAIQASINGVPGSGYPLPPQSGIIPSQGELEGKTATNPTTRTKPKSPGKFIETSPGVLERETRYISPTTVETVPQPSESYLGANVSGVTQAVSQEGYSPPQMSVQEWHLASAADEYAALQDMVDTTSVSAAAGGIRSTTRPPASDAGFWGVPMRVTPGVPARTSPEVAPVAPTTQGVIIAHPTGMAHPLNHLS